MKASTKKSFVLKLPLLVLLAAGCASQKTVKEYQDELRALREERTQLKKENRDLRMQNESYEVQLAEANAHVETPAAIPDNTALDQVGVDYGQDRFGNFFVSIPSSITFASGKADLTKQGKEALKVVADTLKRDHKEGNYWIEGHTDTDPITKSSWDSNRSLSSARAMAVLSYLVEDCDVPDERCVIVGHGQYDPIATGNDSAAKARNRRVEIVVRQQQ
jgi:chemotaxis protein MotB